MSARNSGQWRWLWVTALVVLLDQWTKHLIVTGLEFYQTRMVLPVFDIVHAHNTGAAFSFLNDQSGWQRWLFAALSATVSVGLVIWLRRLAPRAQLLAAALAFILGGALGNLIDRLRLGYVIDFIQVHWQLHYFPAFNVADSAITVGAVLLLLDTWISGRR
jgi:signal peptidase II